MVSCSCHVGILRSFVKIVSCGFHWHRIPYTLIVYILHVSADGRFYRRIRGVFLVFVLDVPIRGGDWSGVVLMPLQGSFTTLAPACFNSAAMSGRLPDSASPSKFSLEAETSAPCNNNCRIVSTSVSVCCFSSVGTTERSTARSNAVKPSLFFALTSAPCASNRRIKRRSAKHRGEGERRIFPFILHVDIRPVCQQNQSLVWPVTAASPT